MDNIKLISKCYYCDKYIKSMRLKEDVGFIYGIKVQGRYYVGLSKKPNLTSRFNEHCTNSRLYSQVINYILQSSRLYEYFIITFEKKTNLEQCEIYWINEYNSFREGWNSTPGGESQSDYDRKELSQMWINRYKNGYISKRIGCKHTEESKKKIGELASVRYKGEGNPRWEKGTPVVCLTLDGDLVRIFDGGTRQAEREMNIPHTHISSVCKHKPHHHTLGGYKWVYLEEYLEMENNIYTE